MFNKIIAVATLIIVSTFATQSFAQDSAEMSFKAYVYEMPIAAPKQAPAQYQLQLEMAPTAFDQNAPRLVSPTQQQNQRGMNGAKARLEAAKARINGTIAKR